MGCCMSSPREGPREPHSNLARPGTITESENTAERRNAAREIFYDAEVGWICKACKHYNRGKHSKRGQCYRRCCRKTSRKPQTVRVFDRKDTAEEMRDMGLTARCGWYHTRCGKYYSSLGDSQECTSPECDGDGGDIKYTCEDETSG